MLALMCVSTALQARDDFVQIKVLVVDNGLFRSTSIVVDVVNFVELAQPSLFVLAEPKVPLALW